MRKILIALAGGFLLLGAGVAQERGTDKPIPCDMKEIVKMSFCGECGVLADKNELDKHKEHKDKLVDAEVCVKKCYEGCHKGPQAKPYS